MWKKCLIVLIMGMTALMAGCAPAQEPVGRTFDFAKGFLVTEGYRVGEWEFSTGTGEIFLSMASGDSEETFSIYRADSTEPLQSITIAPENLVEAFTGLEADTAYIISGQDVDDETIVKVSDAGNRAK